MQTGIGLGGVYFRPSNGEPTPTLTIFSRQLSDTYLGMSQLPPEFLQDLNQWALIAKVHATSPRYFIPANKKKYALVHDGDYCEHAAGTAAPPEDECEEMNAEAADADTWRPRTLWRGDGAPVGRYCLSAAVGLQRVECAQAAHMRSGAGLPRCVYAASGARTAGAVIEARNRE